MAPAGRSNRVTFQSSSRAAFNYNIVTMAHEWIQGIIGIEQFKKKPSLTILAGPAKVGE